MTAIAGKLGISLDSLRVWVRQGCDDDLLDCGAKQIRLV